MEPWQNPVVATAIMLALLLGAAELLRGLVPPLHRLGIPASIVAGLLGLLLGPELVGLLPLSTEVLEVGVYHALGIVFIALGLQTPAEGTRPQGAKAMAFGITFVVALQTVVGLGVVMGLGLFMEPVHPGLGQMLSLAFEGGPGQALSIGGAWEQSGMPDGAQVGLIIAALGFAWSIGMGVPLVAWGRHRGLLAPVPESAPGLAGLRGALPELSVGSLSLLGRQVALVGALYALTWAACLGLSTALAATPDIANMAWGFHFIIGALLAMLLRPFIARLPGGNPVHNETMAHIAAVTVDFATLAALAAIQLAVLRAHWLPLLLVTSLGGFTTLLATVYLARRAFPEAPFEHCVLWFGMSTGTLPTGLALLRMIDPELRSPASINIVLGSAGAIIGVAPVFMLIHPIAIVGWNTGWPTQGWIGLAVATTYLLGVLALWRLFGGLKLRVGQA